MKFKIIILLLLAVPFALNAQFSRHRTLEHIIKKATATVAQKDTTKSGGGGVAADTLFTIISTNGDTSRVYESYAHESLQADLTSTAAGAAESTDVSIVTLMASEDEYDQGIPDLSEFMPVDTNTVTADGWIILTDGSPAYPSAKWIAWRVFGNAGNDSTTVKLKRSAYNPNKK